MIYNLKSSLVLAFSLVFFFNSSFAQQEQKYTIEDKPDWVKLLYGQSPDPHTIAEAYELYYSTHELVKNSDTQYYKRWLVAKSRALIDDHLSIEDKSKLQKEQQLFVEKKILLKQKSPTSSWQSIGPFDWDHGAANRSYAPGAAHVFTLEQSISNPDVLYSGTANAGIWKSIDRGLHWTSLTSDLVTGGVTALEISITDEDVVYTEMNSSIWKTADGGLVWFQTGDVSFQNLNQNAKDIISHPSQSNTLFLASNHGFYKTTDGGVSWVSKLAGDVLEIEIHPTLSSTMYLTLLNGNFTEFYSSIDSGENWTNQVNGWPTALGKQKRTEIAVSPDEPDMVFALATGSANGGSGLYGVYKSIDKGVNWSFECCGPQPAGVPSVSNKNLMGWSDQGTDNGGQYYYDLAFAVSPNDADTILIGGVNLWISSDGGQDFICPSKWSHPHKPNYVHADIHDIKYNENTNEIWLCGDGGIFYSDDNGANFERRIFGISGTGFWGFGAGFWDGEVMLGGAYHNGTLLKDNDVFQNGWICTDGGDGTRGYVNQGREKFVFSDYNMKKLSGDRTVAYETFSFFNKPNASYTIGKTFRLLFHPNYYDSWYTATGSVLFRTENNGVNYESIHDFNEVIAASALSDSDPNYLYVTTFPGWWDTKHIFRSADAGMSWTDITPSSGFLGGTTWVPYDIVIDPQDPLKIWIARTSMYGSTNLNGRIVYSSSDGGTTWINESTSALDGEAITNLVYQKGTDGGIYLGTRRGVYYKNNQMVDWQLFSTDLPVSAKSVRLVPYYRKSKLRNATNQSVWEVDLYENSTPIAMPSVDRYQALCVKDTFYFKDHSIVSEDGVSWSWSFPGGTPSSSTLRSPKVIYDFPGEYDVSLTVTDVNGSSNILMEKMVAVGTTCTPDQIAGNALYCDGNPDHCVIPGFSANTNTLTVTAWVKPDGIQDNYTGIFFNDGTSAGLNLRGGNNTLGYHWPGGSWSWNSGLVVPENEWSYVALVASPSSMTLYVNGVASIHNTNLSTVQFQQCRIGSYKAWNSRNFKGEIDEVAVWDRSLSQDEIRELRHLTKIPDSFPDMIAYYQFNNETTQIPDKTGQFHAQFVGNAGLQVSSAPVGKGESQRLAVTSGGAIDFSNVGMNIGFPVSGNNPDGELVISRLDVLPYNIPDQAIVLPYGYWVVNNYGNNQTFSGLDSIAFYDFFVSDSMALAKNKYSLYKRNDNEFLDDWALAGQKYKTVKSGLKGSIQFNSTTNIIESGQFMISREAFKSDTAAITFSTMNNVEISTEGGESIALHVKGENQGIKFPILNHAEMVALKSPPEGLVIFLEDSLSICYFNGTQWQLIKQNYISELNAANPVAMNAVSLGSTSHATASLALDDHSGGVLLVPFTDIATTKISYPLNGMMMYRLDLHKLCIYNGTSWIPFHSFPLNSSIDTSVPDYVYDGFVIGASAKNSNSIMEIANVDKALLIPQEDYLDIPSPTEGLMIFDVEKNAILVYSGTAWQELIIE